MASPNADTHGRGSKYRSSESEGNGKKRKFEDGNNSNILGTDQTIPLLQHQDLPEFNLTSARVRGDDSSSLQNGEARERSSSPGWQTVENRAKKKAKKIPKRESKNYPAIEFSKDSRFQSQIKISDLQTLVLYILADGSSPQFVAVRHRPSIRKVVVLMIPGLEMSMFEKENDVKESQSPKESRDSHSHSHKGRDRNYRSPDDYFPSKLRENDLPAPLKEFATMFEHIWPIKTPGDDRFGKMHSPLHAMLTAPQQKSKEEKQWSKNKKGPVPVKEPNGWHNNRTPVTEFILSAEDLLENDYTLHPAMYLEEDEKIALAGHRLSAGVSKAHGWVDTLVKNFDDGIPPEDEIEEGSITAGREILAMDCEMCMTGDNEFSLTRISIVGWDGSVVMDELVKPEKPITNYLTQYSGITEKMLAPVTTNLADIQKKLLEMFHPRTILIGHSLNSDLTALKITHPYIIDTALLYPHPRGPPLKSSLKWLAQRYLNREIQKGHGTTGPGAGHDSIEDARTCLDLVKMKCEKGKEWGAGDNQGENIFKRVARTGVKYKSQGGSSIPNPMDAKTSAAIDWGNPRKGPGAAATFQIGCQSDEEVMEGVIRAVKGDSDGKEIPGGGVDFIWARFRELEALKGWWNNNKLATAEAASKDLSKTSTVDAAEEKETPGGDSNETGNETSERPAKAIQLATNSLPPPTLDSTSTISEATSQLTHRIAQIYSALPPCTAFIIYSGSGDPREMSRLQAMQLQFKREYKIKKWDQLSVKWTDTEEQALKKAAINARNGIGFIGVK